ncbi:Nucleolar protein 12 [Trametes pubescens]|uniref:Nucleolar protein 12 n=1 Tax=Trametes pubescens TaxID=154538 RepID=A0A1M2VQX5_TRAPU|nr:Nucleolar protein 12 [Trametes pubescens]
MSLSSLLFPAKGKAKAIDKGLDDLFRSSAAVAPPRPVVPAASTPAAAATPTTPSDRKRKVTEETPTGKTKKSKSDSAAAPSSSKSASKPEKKEKKKKHAKVASSSESEVDEDAKLQEQMHKKKSKKRVSPEPTHAAEEEAESSKSDSSDEEGDPSKLVHESLLKGSQAKSQSRHGKAKYVPAEESPEQRDARTIFVGNVAVDVTKSKPMQKQLQRHLLAFVPGAKIESVRYRSVAFKKPTAELPTDATPGGKAKKPAREHTRDRTATWRADNPNDDEDAEPRKAFLMPNEKKRIAFIKHEIHEHIDAVNAYVVFAHPPPPGSHPANLPPPAPVMDPHAAAAECAAKADGSVFEGRTLRVDVVKKGAGAGAGAAGSKAGTLVGDPKATIFVGSLDFASKEEDLRAFFESVVKAERGEPGQRADDESSGSDEDEEAAGGERPRTWVKRVRIIRDRDTQLGKGFAYVQFVDRQCVDEIIALEAPKLKFAKRKLRVERCKTLPGAPKLKSDVPIRPPARTARPDPPHMHSTRHGPVPRGNPALGAQLAHLPKDERKRAKATDPERVARRLAKKRAGALAEKGVKSVRAGEKERERVRKPRAAGGKDRAVGKEQRPKKRVRSGQAIAKMNTKK